MADGKNPGSNGLQGDLNANRRIAANIAIIALSLNPGQKAG
jgi:hypothetical protein